MFFVSLKEDEEDARQTADGGAINQKEFCHPVASDLASIDAL